MIRPQPRVIIAGANSWQRRNGASTFTANTARHSSSGTSIQCWFGAIPTLLTRMSTWPGLLPIRDDIGLARDVRAHDAWHRRRSLADQVRRLLELLIAAVRRATASAPPWANPSAIILPSPVPDPVTSARRPGERRASANYAHVFRHRGPSPSPGRREWPILPSCGGSHNGPQDRVTYPATFLARDGAGRPRSRTNCAPDDTTIAIRILTPHFPRDRAPTRAFDAPLGPDEGGPDESRPGSGRGPEGSDGRSVYDVAVLQKALDVLEVLAEPPDLGFSELSARDWRQQGVHVPRPFDARGPGVRAKDPDTRKYSPGVSWSR